MHGSADNLHLRHQSRGLALITSIVTSSQIFIVHLIFSASLSKGEMHGFLLSSRVMMKYKSRGRCRDIVHLSSINLRSRAVQCRICQSRLALKNPALTPSILKSLCAQRGKNILHVFVQLLPTEATCSAFATSTSLMPVDM